MTFFSLQSVSTTLRVFREFICASKSPYYIRAVHFLYSYYVTLSKPIRQLPSRIPAKKCRRRLSMRICGTISTRRRSEEKSREPSKSKEIFYWAEKTLTSPSLSLRRKQELVFTRKILQHKNYGKIRRAITEVRNMLKMGNLSGIFGRKEIERKFFLNFHTYHVLCFSSTMRRNVLMN